MYPISSVKANVSRLWECDLKLFRRGFPLAIWDAPSAYLRQVGRLSGGFIYSRIKGWRLNRRSARSLLPAVRAVCGVFYGGRLWHLLKEISERLASLFPQAQASQGFEACLITIWRKVETF